ncbi:hypothetical protein MMC13_007862 [Lambiella insularis]|nr:hypothetical protein [Lambiella insularis]
MENPIQADHEEHQHFNELANRDPTVMVVTLQTKSGDEVHVWAEMDTGSFENLISQELLEKLDLSSEVNSREEVSIKTISGKDFTPKGDIDLTFTAGHKQKAFTSNFVIIEDNDIPLLLGRDMLYKQLHAFSTDVEYQNEPPEDMEIWGTKPSATRVDKLYMAKPVRK